MAFDDEGYEIARILDSRWNNYQNFWEVYVAWRGFETIDYTWEPLISLYRDAPVHVKRCLSELPNSTEVLSTLS